MLQLSISGYNYLEQAIWAILSQVLPEHLSPLPANEEPRTLNNLCKCL